MPQQPLLTRRHLIRAGAGLAAGTLLPWPLSAAAGAPLRNPDSLPDPTRPAGEPTAAMPFDHIVVVMMENHSFDNYFGMLPARGQPLADGFSFDASGRPLNDNPVNGGRVRVYHTETECQPKDVPGDWTEVHQQMDGGRMDGFARTGKGALSSLLYFDENDLPFYYSLARTFTLGNRWFCSVPAPTFPNRRFLLAATAYGNISTDIQSLSDPPPPNGTLFDRLEAHSISWRNYYVDLPGTGVIPSIGEKAPQNLVPISQFFADCASGSLPSVSFVDPEFGATDELKAILSTLGYQPTTDTGELLATQGGDEENPQDVQYGESFVARVVNAVLASPLWPRTLLLYTYDEHGGYYDHVPPPAAVTPDSIPPKLGPHDIKDGYDVYGPRVPAVVVSPYSRPHGVTNVVHDHTSVAATIQAKWNLPACTRRDANATTVMDFLDLSRPALLEPPQLAPAADPSAGAAHCSNADPNPPIEHGSAPLLSASPAIGRGRRLILRFYGRRRAVHGNALAVLEVTGGALVHVRLILRSGGHAVASGRVAAVAAHPKRVVIHPPRGRRLHPGRYRLEVVVDHRVVLTRTVHLG